MNKLQYAFILIVSAFPVLCFPMTSLPSGIINGDFSQDPPGYGWSFSDEGVDLFSDSTAWNNNGLGVLFTFNESEPNVSELYQDNILLQPGDTQMIFDLVMYKSVEGGETDIFTATFGTVQYTLLASDFAGTEYSQTVVMNLSSLTSGAYNLSFQLENDPDGIETTVLIDNVQFIPAPGALLLGIIGIFSTAASRKLKA